MTLQTIWGQWAHLSYPAIFAPRGPLVNSEYYPGWLGECRQPLLQYYSNWNTVLLKYCSTVVL